MNRVFEGRRQGSAVEVDAPGSLARCLREVVRGKACIDAARPDPGRPLPADAREKGPGLVDEAPHGQIAARYG